MNNSTLKIIRPFGPPLGITPMPTDLIAKINHFIDEKIDKNSSDYDHGKHLAGQVSQEIKLPKEIIDDGLLTFLSALTSAYIENSIGKKITKFELIASWVVRQFKNEYNPPHIHGGHISGVGYLKIPDSFGSSFQESKKSNTHGDINFFHGSKQFLSMGTKSKKPILGDFYIFPNYMTHSVNAFFSEGERRSLSFNANIDENIYDVYSDH